MRSRIGTTGTNFFDSQKHRPSGSIRVQSQEVSRRPNTINQSFSSKNRIERLRLANNDFRSSSNLTDDLLSQNKENSGAYIEYRPRKVIPLNMMNVGNINAVDEGSNNIGKNLLRFQDSYTSPYSQKHIQEETKTQYFNLRNRNKLSNRVGFFKPVTNSKLRNTSYNAYTDADLNQRQSIPEVIETENDSQSQLIEQQLIYIIPDGVDVIKDKYKIYKRDIKPYIDTMLPNKEEIEK